jgi:hypothetical protein
MKIGNSGNTHLWLVRESNGTFALQAHDASPADAAGRERTRAASSGR